jgi:carbonic anhydrase/acetyltransferase-like protein (isoleucine patch superfamily)
MPLFSFEGAEPVIAPGAWIAPTASLIGNVFVEDGASVWYNVVLRADFGAIIVRAGANVQDGSVVHGDTEIGPGVTIGHSCVVHGARIGTEALIGNGAIVLDGAVIGSRTLVAAGSVVSPNTVLPDDVLVVGSPARVRGPIPEHAQHWVRDNPEFYRNLARRYAAGSELIS